MRIASQESSCETLIPEEILGFLAHDLRAPLGPLVLSVSAITEDQRADPELRELAGIAHAQAERLARLIDGLLIATRGARALSMRAIDIAEIARQSIHDATAFGVACRLDAPPSCPGHGDEDALRRALTGLLECSTAGPQVTEMKVVPKNHTICVLITPGARGRFGDSLAGIPCDAASVLALSAARVFASHGGAIEISERCISAWLPSERPA